MRGKFTEISCQLEDKTRCYQHRKLCAKVDYWIRARNEGKKAAEEFYERKRVDFLINVTDDFIYSRHKIKGPKLDR